MKFWTDVILKRKKYKLKAAWSWVDSLAFSFVIQILLEKAKSLKSEKVEFDNHSVDAFSQFSQTAE